MDLFCSFHQHQVPTQALAEQEHPGVLAPDSKHSSSELLQGQNSALQLFQSLMAKA